MSHGSMDDHERVLERVRQAAAATGTNLAVMVDLRGLEIRTGKVEGGAAVLQPGQPFSLYTDGRVGSSARHLGVATRAWPRKSGWATSSSSTTARSSSRWWVCAAARSRPASSCGGTLRETRKVNVPGKDLDTVAAPGRGSRGSRVRGVERRRLRGGLVRALGGGHRGDPRLPQGPRLRAADHRQDREPPRRRAPAGDRGGRRRHHGGARRPRRRGADGRGPGAAEADHPRHRHRRQAGHHRHPDARLDGAQPAADARRGVATWPTPSSTAARR